MAKNIMKKLNIKDAVDKVVYQLHVDYEGAIREEDREEEYFSLRDGIMTTVSYALETIEEDNDIEYEDPKEQGFNNQYEKDKLEDKLHHMEILATKYRVSDDKIIQSGLVNGVDYNYHLAGAIGGGVHNFTEESLEIITEVYNGEGDAEEELSESGKEMYVYGYAEKKKKEYISDIRRLLLDFVDANRDKLLPTEISFFEDTINKYIDGIEDKEEINERLTLATKNGTQEKEVRHILNQMMDIRGFTYIPADYNIGI